MNGIEFFRILSLRGGLELEILGLKRSRGSSAYSLIKKEFNFKGSKKDVLEQLEEHISKIKQERIKSNTR
jgi:hypothetical protein